MKISLTKSLNNRIWNTNWLWKVTGEQLLLTEPPFLGSEILGQ